MIVSNWYLISISEGYNVCREKKYESITEFVQLRALPKINELYPEADSGTVGEVATFRLNRSQNRVCSACVQLDFTVSRLAMGDSAALDK